LHSVPDEPEDAAAIVGEQVHPVLDGPPERGHGPLDRQQQHLDDEGDEDDPPPPPLGDLGADGAVDGVVVGDLAGAQQVEQAPEAALVRPQHHEVAEEVVPAVHDGSPMILRPAGRPRSSWNPRSNYQKTLLLFSQRNRSNEAIQQEHRIN